jgi:hypothetical protein
LVFEPALVGTFAQAATQLAVAAERAHTGARSTSNPIARAR